jgi:predicted Zn-dependent peptidase
LKLLSNQADALGRSEISGGWEALDQLTENVNKAKLADINATFDKYSDVIVWIYLGKKDAVKTEDFKQTTPKEKKSKPY